jgi:fatty acid desaturase
LSIALNLQTVHHLFPQVDSSHYSSIARILRSVCAKFQVQINVVPSVTDAAKQHFLHIWAINSEVNNHHAHTGVSKAVSQ